MAIIGAGRQNKDSITLSICWTCNKKELEEFDFVNEQDIICEIKYNDDENLQSSIELIKTF